jgi:general secretion pathway protein G
LRIAGADLKGKGDLRKDRFLVPLNSDYDLYSMVKDGASKGPLTAAESRDDILRANNGAFIGVAVDY